MTPRVLVTSIGDPAGRSVAAQLRARGLAVIGTDTKMVNAPLGVAFAGLPPAGHPEMIPSLRRLVVLEGVDLILPTSVDELLPLAAARDGFGQHVRVIVGDPGPVAVANDRLYTAWELQAAGVPVPRFGVPGDYRSARAAMADIGGPAVIRPRTSRGGRELAALDGDRDISWDSLPHGQIVQEHVPGESYTSLVYGTPAHNAAAPFAVVLKRTDSAAGARAPGLERVNAGAAMDVAALAKSAVRCLALTGPVEVRIRRRADGIPVVLGIRACLGASSAAAPEMLDAILGTLSLPAFNPASFRRCTDVAAWMLA